MRLFYCVVMMSLLTMSGCTLLPGTSARYVEADELQDGADQKNYTLVKVTPSLVSKMQQQDAAKAKQLVGTGPLGESSTTYKLGPQDSLRILSLTWYPHNEINYKNGILLSSTYTFICESPLNIR